MNTTITSVPSLESLGVTRREAFLKNGVRVVLFEKPHAPLAVRVNFLSGARYDPAGKEGIAHFVEHMLVAGTKSFPQKDLLARYLERVGGSMGATTSHESVYLNATISEADDLPTLGTFLEETLLHSLFDPKTVETERGSIQKELAEKNSQPRWVSLTTSFLLVFQKTQFDHPVLGDEKTVAGITHDDLVAYAKEMMTADRTTVIASGGVKLEDFVKILETSVGQLPKSTPPFVPPRSVLPAVREKYVSIVPLPAGEDATHAYLDFNFRIGSSFDPDSSVLNLIADVIGGGRASILSTKLRYEEGLVYSAHAQAYEVQDMGQFSISASTDPKNVKKAIEIITKIVRETKEKGFDPDLILASQQAAVKSLRGEYETSLSWAHNHAYNESIGLGDRNIVEATKAFIKVTNDDVIRVARKYFTNDNWYLAVAGPLSEKDIPDIAL